MSCNVSHFSFLLLRSRYFHYSIPPPSLSSSPSLPLLLHPLLNSLAACRPSLPLLVTSPVGYFGIFFFQSLSLRIPVVSSPHSRSPSPSSHDTLTLRALVSTKEAGIIIGKAGKNVADLREQTGVKAGVSKVITGVHERVLTVTGSVESVSKVYSLFQDHKKI